LAEAARPAPGLRAFAALAARAEAHFKENAPCRPRAAAAHKESGGARLKTGGNAPVKSFRGGGFSGHGGRAEL